jgi:acetyl esterase
MQYFRTQYVSGEHEYALPYASPLFADDLSGLPPALIVTGEHDGLRAEGERYAVRLREAGVFANAYCQRGAGHLSATFARVAPEAAEALDVSVVALRAALHPLAGG